MASWTTPRTWTTGELVTKAIMDTHVRDNLHFLGGTGFGTSLPGSPVDLDPFILTDSLTAPTYLWHLRYFSARSSNKWVCYGGTSLYAMISTGGSETTGSTSYIALTTAGPSLAVPVAGEYLVALGAEMDNDTGGARMSFDIGGTPASDNDRVGFDAAAAATNYPSLSVERKKTLTAVTLTAKYRAVTSGTAGFRDRWMKVTPLYLGG